MNETQNLLEKLSKAANQWFFFGNAHAEEVHNAVSGLSPLKLAALDPYVRRSTYYRNWNELKPSGVRRLSESKFAASLVGIASFHYSGYVREAAVAELASLYTGKELPFLLIRLNDWVVQIREAAVQAVRARMEPAYAIHFLSNISLVLRLRICGRVDKRFVDEVFNLLKNPACKEILQSGTISKDKTIRRISFQLAAEADPSSRVAIIRAVITDSDPVARSWVVQHLLPEVALDELPGVVEPMLKDRYMPVRRAALWIVAKKRPDFASHWLCSALLDDHVSMRETARQFLPIAGVKDVQSFYSDAISTGGDNRRSAAICGLGETGMKEDVQLIVPYLASNITKLRRAAVYAIGKLDLEGQFQRLTTALSDAKPSISWQAMKAILPKARYVPLENLQDLMDGNSRFYVRRNAFTLVLRYDKWKRIPPLVKACADSDARFAERAVKALRDWSVNYNKSFAEPTREDFEKINVALAKYEKALPHKQVDNLLACLRIYFP